MNILRKIKGNKNRPSKFLAKLEHLIRRENWIELQRALNSDKCTPELLDNRAKKKQKVDIDKSDSSSRDLHASMPLLNLAILYKAPLEIVQSFLEIQPDLTLRSDSNGMTPIHVACATQGTSYDLIKLLVCHDKGMSASRQDYFGKTPLHHLLFYVCYPNNRQLNEWKHAGHCFSIGSDEMSQYSNTSLNMTSLEDALEQPLSFSQEDLERCNNSLSLLSQAAYGSYFVRDMFGNTPVDILHDCKTRSVAECHSPKWERVDIVNMIAREILVKNYKRMKDAAERTGWDTSDKDGSSVLSRRDSSSCEASSCITDALMNMSIDSLSSGGLSLEGDIDMT